MADTTRKKLGIVKVLVIAAVLLAAIIIALPFVVDANKFRPQLESKLSSALGRKVKVGTLKLSVLSGSIAVDNIRIADNPAFSSSPFVQAESLKVGVELKLLILSQKVQISGISLDSPSITLIRSASGKWNFSDIGSKGGLNKDETKGKEAGGLSGTGVFIKQLKITGGRILVDRGERLRKPSTYDNVNIAASNLSLSSAFPFSLKASLPGGGSIKLEGKAGPLNTADALLTPLAADLAVTHFDLVSSGFATPGSGIAGVIDFSGDFKSDGRLVQCKGQASADKLQFVKSGPPAGRPISLTYGVRYDLTNHSGMLDDATVACGKAIAHLSGNYGVHGDGLSLKMRLHGAEMPVQDLKTLLPAFGITLPKGASLEGGVLNADLTAEGPIEKMVTTGKADISNARLTGFDLAGKMAVIASLAGIKSNSETEIEKLASNMKVTPEGTQVSDLLLIVPALGQLSGDGRIGPDKSLDFKMKAMLKPSGGLGGSLLQLLKGGNVLEVPFYVRGTASEPKFVPDLKKAADSLLGSASSQKGTKEGQKDLGQTLGNALRDLMKKKKQ